MVKIRDLSDKQLDSQISKYTKILDQLLEEKSRRGMDDEELDKTQEYHLKLDDAEIEQIEKKKVQKSQEKDSENQEKKVGVTQILNINKDLLKK